MRFTVGEGIRGTSVGSTLWVMRLNTRFTRAEAVFAHEDYRRRQIKCGSNS